MTHPIKQSDYWDSVLDPQNLSTDSLSDFDLSLEQAFYQTPAQEYAYQKMGELKGKKVLEIGCGMGVNSTILSQKGAFVTAIDIAQNRLDRVKQLLRQRSMENIYLCKGDGQSLPFSDHSFDIVFMGLVFHETDDSFGETVNSQRDLSCLKTRGNRHFGRTLEISSPGQRLSLSVRSQNLAEDRIVFFVQRYQAIRPIF